MSKNKKTIFNPLWLEDEFKSWLCSSKESDKDASYVKKILNYRTWEGKPL